jgi:hypothetical protein
MKNGAKKYSSTTTPSIRTQIKNKIDFSSFLTSFVDIQRAAQVSPATGYLDTNDNALYDGWRLTFQAGGTVLVQSCRKSGTSALEAAAPTCGTGTPSYSATIPVPANGAIYATKSVLVSGQLNGRVTVASNDDIIIANNISYVSSGDDVLGLIAKNRRHRRGMGADQSRLAWSRDRPERHVEGRGQHDQPRHDELHRLVRDTGRR